MRNAKTVEYTRLTRNNVLEKFQQGVGQGKNITGETFTQFQENKKKMREGKVLNFIESQSLYMFQKFQDQEVIKPTLLSQILRKRPKTFTMWSDFQRKPKKQFFESMICVVKG